MSDVIARWLYRRYAAIPQKPKWELLGGVHRAVWINDADAILDALEKEGCVITMPGTSR